jgi:DNA-binding MarR family transcriptional regulator
METTPDDASEAAADDAVVHSATLDSELFAAVRGVAFAARVVERRLTDASLAQLRVLALIARDPIRASALAHDAALSRPTLTGVLEVLVAKGWVERRAVDGDRRGVTLSITPEGRTALEEAAEQASAALAELLAVLDEPDRAQATRALANLTVVARDRYVWKSVAPTATTAGP